MSRHFSISRRVVVILLLEGGVVMVWTLAKRLGRSLLVDFLVALLLIAGTKQALCQQKLCQRETGVHAMKSNDRTIAVVGPLVTDYELLPAGSVAPGQTKVDVR
ncbi:MAG: hypothetical protein HYV60_01135, partial [Planctomycetia bacterium]|nr:hypothetical protein [Planctomycetia bacterium]